MDKLDKVKIHKTSSVIMIVTGFILLVMMIYTEDEPGAIPLLLLVIGTGWYFLTRFREKNILRKDQIH